MVQGSTDLIRLNWTQTKEEVLDVIADDNFNDLRAKVKQGGELNFMGFEPVFYLVFDPSQIIEVRGNCVHGSLHFQER